MGFWGCLVGGIMTQRQQQPKHTNDANKNLSRACQFYSSINSQTFLYFIRGSLQRCNNY